MEPLDYEEYDGPRYYSVTVQEYVDFLAKWLHDTQHDGPYKDLRLGQAFVCYFNIAHDPELFYETDKDRAINLIALRYMTKPLNSQE